MENDEIIKVLLNNVNEKFDKIDNKLDGFNKDFNELKSFASDVSDVKSWKSRIDEVVSPTQLKELKDEVYKQKNRWTAVTAILAFIQISIAIYFSASKSDIANDKREKNYNKEVVLPKDDYNNIKDNYVIKEK